MRNRRANNQAVKTIVIYLIVFIIIGIGAWLLLDLTSNDKEQNKETEVKDATKLAERHEENMPADEKDFDDIEAVMIAKDVDLLSEKLIKALDEHDMDTIATYVDNGRGLLFSPYVNITDDAKKFEQNEVAALLEDEETYTWGDYDGKGTPIELTPEQFFDEFLDMDPLIDPDEVLINDPQDRGNTVNNIKETFPDATVVEYYDAGSEEYAGIDWSSVNLVYERDDQGIYTLVAIVRNMWTI